MRIYDGSPRQDFEEVFRSIGAFLDTRGTRDNPCCWRCRTASSSRARGGGRRPEAWWTTVGTMSKETLTFMARRHRQFMEEAAARRGEGGPGDNPNPGAYEQALRVIGRWMDEQKPKDVFLFEQEGAYVIRLLVGGQAGVHHELAEFTHDDIVGLVAQAPRSSPATGGTAAPARLDAALPGHGSGVPGGAAGPCRRAVTSRVAPGTISSRSVAGGPTDDGLRTVAVALGVTLVPVVIPLVVLAGLFVWLMSQRRTTRRRSSSSRSALIDAPAPDRPSASPSTHPRRPPSGGRPSPRPPGSPSAAVLSRPSRPPRERRLAELGGLAPS